MCIAVWSSSILGFVWWHGTSRCCQQRQYRTYWLAVKHAVGRPAALQCSKFQRASPCRAEGQHVVCTAELSSFVRLACFQTGSKKQIHASVAVARWKNDKHNNAQLHIIGCRKSVCSVYFSSLVGTHSSLCSNGEHLSYDGCLKLTGEYNQNCCVLRIIVGHWIC